MVCDGPCTNKFNMDPLSSLRQLKMSLAFIQRMIDNGNKLIAGGERISEKQGYFILPTIFEMVCSSSSNNFSGSLTGGGGTEQSAAAAAAGAGTYFSSSSSAPSPSPCTPCVPITKIMTETAGPVLCVYKYVDADPTPISDRVNGINNASRSVIFSRDLPTAQSLVTIK